MNLGMEKEIDCNSGDLCLREGGNSGSVTCSLLVRSLKIKEERVDFRLAENTLQLFC